jgi:hypothetical protein
VTSYVRCESTNGGLATISLSAEGVEAVPFARRQAKNSSGCNGAAHLWAIHATVESNESLEPYLPEPGNSAGSGLSG